MTTQENIFMKIAQALLVDYTSVYYVNATTNEYCWYSVDPRYQALNLEKGGDDFFRDIIRDCKKVIHPEDQHFFVYDIQKEKLLGDMDSVTDDFQSHAVNKVSCFDASCVAVRVASCDAIHAGIEMGDQGETGFIGLDHIFVQCARMCY